MNGSIDIYHELLGIPPAEQPPNHYRLLGITDFESNPQVISNAARRQMSFIRPLGSGKYSKESQRLLNELAAAKLCLLDPAKRQAYDAQMHRGRTIPSIKMPTPSEQVVAVNQVESPSSVAAPPRPPAVAAGIQLVQPGLERNELAGDSWQLVDSPMLPTPSTSPAKGGEWIVGSEPESWILLRSSSVSRRHCQISRCDGVYFIQDCGSLNGTYVNSVQVLDKVSLDAGDVITLGRVVRLPWPLPPSFETSKLVVLNIGRLPVNDYVIDDPTVSKCHAQLILREGQVVLLDLQSANGTSIGKLENRIASCLLEPHLSVFFGSRRVLAEELINLAYCSRDQS